MIKLIFLSLALTFAPLNFTLCHTFDFMASESCNLYTSFIKVVLLLVVLYIASTLQKKIFPLIPIIFLCILTLHAQWGIAQFIFQENIGFTHIGESRIDANTPAVAKFDSGFGKLIRSYGPYPHPNDFAGTLALGFAVAAMTMPSQLPSILLPIFSIGILTSFSRAALISAALAIAFMLPRMSPRSLAAIGLIAFAFTPLFIPRATDNEDKAISERIRGVQWSLQILESHPKLFGTGYGSYPSVLAHYLRTNNISHEPWEIAPVHNVPLLMAVELGTLPTAALALLTLFFVHRMRAYALGIVLLPLLITDHFFYTHIGSMIWLMCIGIFTWRKGPHRSF